MSTQFDLRGKTILVTGATSGIGKSCAERVFQSGARTIALGRAQEKLDALENIPASDRHALDLSNESALKEFVKSIKNGGVRLNGCVLAAGVHSFRPFFMESFADIAFPWTTNVQSCLGLIALLAKARLFAEGCSVVLFSSAAARTGSPAAASYAASKGAIEAATPTLALEFSSTKIRVNAVAPGVVRTPMSERFLSKLTQDQLARVEAHHPLGFGTTEDVTGPVLFLLSEAANWINGVVLPVDGGYAIA